MPFIVQHSACSAARVLTFVARAITRCSRWNPIGRRVFLHMDDSADARLSGGIIGGVVRAYDVRKGGAFGELLVELEQGLNYAGQYTRADIRWIVAAPCVKWHGAERLTLTWCAARFVDAASFVDATYDRSIGTGRVHLA